MGKLITLEQAAERLAVSKRTVRGLISSGRLAAVRINSRIIRVDERDLASVLTPVTPHVKDWASV
jgi:excisionase family DNA binding protein